MWSLEHWIWLFMISVAEMGVVIAFIALPFVLIAVFAALLCVCVLRHRRASVVRARRTR